jgi:predicted choloylglycine hydrolase
MIHQINRRDFLQQSLKSATALYAWYFMSFLPQDLNAQNMKSEDNGKLLWVETAGSAFEIGRQYGEKVGNLLINQTENSVKRLKMRFESKSMEKAYRVMLDVLEHDFPYLVEEMRGMAARTKLDFKDVALSNLSAGFGAFIEENEDCSNIIFVESDYGPIIGKTLDGSSPESGTAVVRLIQPLQGYTVLCETRINGISTETGINEKGLAVGESSLHFRTLNPRGIIRNILPRLLLQECANVEEGIQFLSKYPLLRYGFHFALVDKIGNAVVVERSPTEMYVRRAEGKTIFCTNHTATPCMRKLELSRGLVGDKNSDERFSNLQRITSSSDFTLTLDNMKNILRNHRVPGGICQHGELEMYTHRAYLAIPNEGKLLVAPGSPCKHEFKEFGLQGIK